MSAKSTKIRKSLNYLIRGAIILITYGFIYRQVFVGRKLHDINEAFKDAFDNGRAWLLPAIVLIMMLMNWGLESAKWRLLIAKIEKLSFRQAFMAVLTGISVSIFTPNRTGDYLGRVFILEKGNHLEGVLLTIVGSFAQLIVTLCVGLFCGLSFSDLYLKESFRLHEYFYSGMILLVPAFVFSMLLIYFNIGILTDIISRYTPSKWNKINDYAAIFKKFSSQELRWVLLLSFLRYLVFSAQFYLLLRFFGAEIPVGQALILIPIIYLVMLVIPSVALTELGIRGSVSLFVLMMYFKAKGGAGDHTELSILAASSLLWLINLILPAVLGSFFVFSLKFFRK